MAALRVNGAVGRCPTVGCDGELLPQPYDPPGTRNDPRPPPVPWPVYEARCGSCHATYAAPYGRELVDVEEREHARRAAQHGRDERRDAHRTAELTGGTR